MTATFRRPHRGNTGTEFHDDGRCRRGGGVYYMANSGAPPEIAQAALKLLRAEDYVPPPEPKGVAVETRILEACLGTCDAGSGIVLRRSVGEPPVAIGAGRGSVLKRRGRVDCRAPRSPPRDMIGHDPDLVGVGPRLPAVPLHGPAVAETPRRSTGPWYSRETPAALAGHARPRISLTAAPRKIGSNAFPWAVP